MYGNGYGFECAALCAQVLTLSPVQAGTELVHHMYDGPFGSSLAVMGGAGLRARGPRLLSDSPQATGKVWKQCALQILHTQVCNQHFGSASSLRACSVTCTIKTDSLIPS
jgi:hypothetical protein